MRWGRGVINVKRNTYGTKGPEEQRESDRGRLTKKDEKDKRRETRTYDGMGGAIELSLEIGDGEGHAEEVDSIASPGQPPKTTTVNHGEALEDPELPREEKTPLGESDCAKDLQQGSCPFHLLFLR
jgi:hypothetical protein